MPAARDARDWVAAGGLRGLGDSLYTPLAGTDGDDIDWDAFRHLVRYCVDDLGHEMLWLCGGPAEYWALTMDERKRLVEIAIDEARSVAPDTVIQVCTTSSAAKETVELTLHAQANGADICYVQTPTMEVHGGEGVLRYFKYVADRTDIALGMFNSPSSGYVLTPEECARIYDEIPAVCALKEGVMEETTRTRILHGLAPGLAIWECDTIVYRAGWLQDGVVSPAQFGSTHYLFETPDKLWCRQYWTLIWEGKLSEASEFAKTSGYGELMSNLAGGAKWTTKYPGRPGYFTHWAEAFKYAASIVGLPIGDYPHGRAPQALLPEEAKAQFRAAYEKAGMAVGNPVPA